MGRMNTTCQIAPPAWVLHTKSAIKSANSMEKTVVKEAETREEQSALRKTGEENTSTAL